VHVYNNLYAVTDAARLGYSIGVGHRSRIVSEANVWELFDSASPRSPVRGWGGQVFSDRGSLLNGRAVDLLALLRAAHPERAFDADVGWTPPHVTAVDRADEVADRVRAQAGAGRLWVR
jgi:pectate lyase